MFERDGEPVLNFRVYDGFGNCVEAYTGTISEWNRRLLRGEVPIMLPAAEQRRWLN